MAQDTDHAGTEIGHQPPAFPQLHPDYWPSQIFWLLVALVVLYYVMSKVALPRIAATLETRRDAIAGDLERAAEYNKRAEAALEARDEARRQAQAEAQRIREAAEAETKAELDAALARAAEQIDAQTAASEARLKEIQTTAGAEALKVATATAEALLERFDAPSVDGATLETELGAQLAGRFGE